MTAVFVLAMIVFFLGLDWILTKTRALATEPTFVPGVIGLSESDLTLKPGLFLAPGHTWLSVTEDGDVRVGIDELARRAFGRPEEVRLPKVGSKVKKGEPVMTFARDGRQIVFRSPVSGTIAAVNPNPTRAGQGWLLSVEPSRLGFELRALRIAEEAAVWLKKEVARFREFLVSSLNAAPALATLPDGGVPAEGVLGILPEETVAAFQDEFLNGDE